MRKKDDGMRTNTRAWNSREKMERKREGERENIKVVGLTFGAVRREEKRLVDHPSRVKGKRVHMRIVVHTTAQTFTHKLHTQIYTHTHNTHDLYL